MNIKEYLRDIPENYRGLSWKILPNNSASPTLIILTNADKPFSPDGCPKKISPLENVCLKVWIKNGEFVADKQSLEYEKKVYADIIRPIIQNDEKAPFLRYIGDDNDCTTVATLANFLGINTEPEMKLFLLSFLIINRLEVTGKRPRDLYVKPTYDKHFITYYTNLILDRVSKEKSLDIIENVKNLKLGVILLPKVKFVTFAKLLTESDARSVDVFKSVLKGLYTLYKNQVVHNDMHCGNIMINEHFDTYIYDWDKSYSPILGDNPSLGKDERNRDCMASKCNIFFDNGRPIDLIKLLSYVALQGPVLAKILKDVFKIENRLIDGVLKYTRIKQALTKYGNFFVIPQLEKSALVNIGLSKSLETVIFDLGSTWDAIYTRAFPDEKEAKEPINAPEIEIVNKLRNLVINTDNPVEAIKSDKADEKVDNRRSFNFTTTLPYQRVEVVKNMDKQSDIDNKNISKIKKLLNTPDDKLTYRDYNKLQDLVEEIAYGPKIQDKSRPLQKSDNLIFRDLGEIIAENQELYENDNVDF